MATRLQNITESTYQDTAPQIDRDKGVLRGVKILGATSKNGRDYSTKALREAAEMYEGLGVNTNHPGRSTPNASRTVEEGVGWLENVTVKPDGVYGDLHVIKSHALAETIFEVAERKPNRFGLSHNAAGDVTERGGRRIVESIKSVRSVDLVQNPATVNSLFESEAPVADRKLSDILETMKPGKQKSHLLSLIEMDGSPMTPEMAVPAMDSEEGASDPYADVIEAGVLAVCRDTSLDNTGKLAKIKALFGLADKMAEPAGGDAPDEEGGGDVKESMLEKRLAAAEALLLEAKTEKDCRALLEGAKLEVTDKRLNLLKAVKDATRKDLIEEWLANPKNKVVAKPARSAPVPLTESEDGAYKPAATAKELAARLK